MKTPNSEPATILGVIRERGRKAAAMEAAENARRKAEETDAVRSLRKQRIDEAHAGLAIIVLDAARFSAERLGLIPDLIDVEPVRNGILVGFDISYATLPLARHIAPADWTAMREDVDAFLEDVVDGAAAENQFARLQGDLIEMIGNEMIDDLGE